MRYAQAHVPMLYGRVPCDPNPASPPGPRHRAPRIVVERPPSPNGRDSWLAGYLPSAILSSIGSAVMFDAKVLTATTQTIMWVVIFFFASAGASAAYLTVSETWPIEIRAEAIAIFFAIGCIAGALGPAFYGALIGNGSSRTGLFVGYLIGAGIMLIGGLVEVFLGVQAAGKSLEQVTKPLTSTDQPTPATQAASTAAA